MNTPFENIKKFFGFDLLDFFDQFNSFVQNDLIVIKNFYNGNLEELPSKEFGRLFSLSSQCSSIYEKFEQYGDNLKTFQYWDVLSYFEDIESKIQTYLNLGKWLKSNIAIKINTVGQNISYVLKKHETLENASTQVGYTSTDSGFTDISVKNRIRENSYDLDGGLSFTFNYKDVGKRLKLNTVVGSLEGEQVYSIDMDRSFVFENDDLKTLSYRETFEQTCYILLSLLKNDNPEFPSDGIDKTIMQNRISAATAFPVVFRQLNRSIYRDDTIRSFVLKNAKYEQDALFMEVEFYSQLNNDVLLLNNSIDAN